MLSEYEAQKLQANVSREAEEPAKQRLLRAMRCEPAWRLGVILKCAVCLLVVAGLALIASRIDPQSEAPLGARETDGATQPLVENEHGSLLASEETVNASEGHAALNAAHHRKAVFDARRRTWEERSYSAEERIAGGMNAP